ncbi:MAG: hypothetical protein GYA16_12135 [Spirochaetes bacterium]|nr:hypothetical protein [Spirochaetota bacterium]
MLKKIYFIIFMLLFVFVNSISFATIMIGAKGGYFFWRPMLKDSGADWASSVENGSGILAGPVISLSLSDDLALTIAGLFGNQSSNWDVNGTEGSNNIHGQYTFNAKRYDIDSAINYTLTPNIKIFAGYKYQYFNVDFKQFKVGYTNVIDFSSIEKVTYESPSHGPAVGIGLGTALNESYFITGNLSFIYFIQSSIDIKMNGKEINTTINSYSGTESIDFVQYGINFEPAIGAKISESVIGTIGTRLVWTSYKLKEDHLQMGLKKGDVWNDYLYGVFVSVVYMM